MADGGIADIVEITRRSFAEYNRHNEQPTTSNAADNVATLLQATNSLFRRSNTREKPPKRLKKRGRKMWSRTRITFVLMDDQEYIKVPGRGKLKALKENGLGEKELYLRRLMTRNELEDHLVSTYNGLTHGFSLMSSSVSHRLQQVLDYEDVGDLKKCIKKGKVYILPPRGIAMKGKWHLEPLSCLCSRRMQNLLQLKNSEPFCSLKMASMMDFGVASPTATSTINPRPATNSRPATSISATNLRPATSISATNPRPATCTSISATNPRPATSISATNPRPATSISAMDFGVASPTATSTINPRPATNSRPATSISATNLRPATSISATNPRPATSISATNPRPATSISATNQRPATSISATNPRPATSISATNPRPATSISATNPRPATSISATNPRPATSISSTNPRPATSISATNPRPATSILATNQRPATSISATNQRPATPTSATNPRPATPTSATNPRPATSMSATNPRPATPTSATNQRPATSMSATNPRIDTSRSMTNPGPSTSVTATSASGGAAVSDMHRRNMWPSSSSDSGEDIASCPWVEQMELEIKDLPRDKQKYRTRRTSYKSELTRIQAEMDQSHDCTDDAYEEIDTPTISFRTRPRRDAAEVARIRMEEWVHTISGISVSPSSSPEVSRPAMSTPARAECIPVPEGLPVAECPPVLGALPEMLISDDLFLAELVSNHMEEEEANIEQPSTASNLSSALKSLAENVLGDVADGCLKIIVRRHSALADAIQNISRAQTRLMQPLAVRFIGEPAVDGGGPSRELSSLVVAQLSSPYVEGIEHNKSFTNDFNLYNTKRYLHLGQLAAVLLLQGGQGIQIFCHSVTEYLLSGEITSSDVDLPQSMRTSIKQLQDMSDRELSNAVDDKFPSRFEEGYPVPSMQLSRDKLPELVQAMVAHHIIQPQKMALDQFIQGLQIGGVLQVLQDHLVDARGLFQGSEAKLTMEVMEGLVVFSYLDLEEGSNAMRIAQSIEQGWVLLLQAAESGEAEFQFGEAGPVAINLSQILQWLTGASRLPAVGFTKKIEIQFDKVAILPKVNTCGLDVYIPLLPRFQDPEIFMKQLVEWVIDSQGFGLI